MYSRFRYLEYDMCVRVYPNKVYLILKVHYLDTHTHTYLESDCNQKFETKYIYFLQATKITYFINSYLFQELICRWRGANTPCWIYSRFSLNSSLMLRLIATNRAFGRYGGTHLNPPKINI